MEMAAGLALTFAVVVAGVLRLSRLWRSREDQAAVLQARVTDVLIRNARVGRLPITVIVQPAFWPWSPLTVAVAGHVPDDEARDAVHAFLRTQVPAHGCHYQDRVVVHPAGRARAA